jgi:hypothetical protein
MAVVSDVLDGARAHVAGERCPDVDLASLPTPPSLEDDILAGETSRGFVSEAVWNSNLQPDFNVRTCDSFDASSWAVLRELDESNRFVPKSAESTSI